MTTLMDIAKRAGVSDVTVSRVLNGADYRRPTFRKRAEKIRRLADDLGYRVNTSARAVREGCFRTLSLLLSSLTTRSMLPASTLHAIHAAAAEHGYIINLGIVEDDRFEDEGFVPKLLSEWHSDGLLINYHVSPPPRLGELLEKYAIPSVWLNYAGGQDCVRPDDFGAGRSATQHLLGLGHRRIAYVGHAYQPRNTHYSGSHRREGYVEAMKHAGLEPLCVERQLVEHSPGLENLEKWVQWLRGPDCPTAIIAYAGVEASLAVTAAARAGKDVPTEISVVTFGGKAGFVGLDLTTWLVPEVEVGRVGVEALLDKMARPEQAMPSRAIPFVFKGGKSVAPAVLVRRSSSHKELL